jgi:hypothetical protein
MATEVFISYSRGDGAFVEQLNRLLQTAGVSTWFDRVNLLPGMKWADVIDDEIPAARVFLACLSPTALDERGYFQVEQQLAAKAALHVPSDRLLVIPVLLSDCTLPRELRQYHTANLFEPGAIQALLSSISDALGRRVEASVESVTELRDALRKYIAAAGPFGSSEFTDPEVEDVVDRLRGMHARRSVTKPCGVARSSGGPIASTQPIRR